MLVCAAMIVERTTRGDAMFLTMIERSATAVDDLDARARDWGPDAARPRRLPGAPGAGIRSPTSWAGTPNAYDRFWFNAYREDLFIGVALGLYPNRGVIDAAVGGGARRRAAVRVRLGRAARRARPRVGPIADRARRADAGRPTVRVDAPDQAIRAELTFTARTCALEEPRQTRHDGARVVMDVTRATQLGTWEGFVELDGERIDARRRDDLRDEGPLLGHPAASATRRRPPRRAAPPQLFFLWAPINFEDTRAAREPLRGRRTASRGARPPRRSTLLGRARRAPSTRPARTTCRASVCDVDLRAGLRRASRVRRCTLVRRGRHRLGRRARAGARVPDARRGVLPPDLRARPLPRRARRRRRGARRRRARHDVARTTSTSSRWSAPRGASGAASACSSSSRSARTPRAGSPGSSTARAERQAIVAHEPRRYSGPMPLDKPHWKELFTDVVTSGLCTGLRRVHRGVPLRRPRVRHRRRPLQAVPHRHRRRRGGLHARREGLHAVHPGVSRGSASGRPRSTRSASGASARTTRSSASPPTSCSPRATDPELAEVGQDGGFVAALLVYALEHDEIDAALVSALEGDGSTWRAVPGGREDARRGARDLGVALHLLGEPPRLQRGDRRRGRADLPRRHGVHDVGPRGDGRAQGGQDRAAALAHDRAHVLQDVRRRDLRGAVRGPLRHRARAHQEDEHQGRLPAVARPTAATSRCRSKRPTPGRARAARSARTSPPSTRTSRRAASARSTTGRSSSCARTVVATCSPRWCATARSRCAPATTTPARSRCSASSRGSADAAGRRRAVAAPGRLPAPAG